jgi:tight adherence protein C
MTSAVLVLTIVAALAAAIASGSLAAHLLSPSGATRRRLQDGAESAGSLVQRLRSKSTAGTTRPAIGAISKPLLQPVRLSPLAHAGYHQPWAPAAYRIVQLCLALVLGLSAWLLLGLAIGLPAALVMGGVGYLAPGLWLGRRVAARRRLIQNGLPDALDLMVVCLEAGAGVDIAIVKAASELNIAHPALADELRLVTAETRAGSTRLAALRNLASRTAVDEVRSLVAMLAQTERFGTSIAQALRTHADVSRSIRRQRAEERAAKIGVKLVFPLVLCMFPALYVVVLGPLVVQFAEVFTSQGRP